MKRADFVDKTVSNALLSMKNPDFVDKVSALVGVSLAWFRRSKFRLHPFANSRTRAVRYYGLLITGSDRVRSFISICDISFSDSAILLLNFQIIEPF